MMRFALLIPVLVALLPQDAWWDREWNFRRKLTLRNPAEAAVPADTLHEVRLDSALLGMDGKCRPGFEDLALTHRGKRIAHTLHSDGPGRMSLWFRTPAAIANGAADADYALYYGNRRAEGGGVPPREIFDFADDFSDAAVSKAWTAEGQAAPQVQGGKLLIADIPAGATHRLPARLLLKAPVPDGFAVSCDVEFEPADGASFAFGVEVALKTDAADGAALDKKIADLIEKLGDGEVETREASMKDLVKIGTPALRRLAEAVRTGDAETRFRADAAIDEILTRQPASIIQAFLRAGEVAGATSRMTTIGKTKQSFPGAAAARFRVTITILRDADGGVTVLWNGIKPDMGNLKGPARDISLVFWRYTDAPIGRVTVDNFIVRKHVDDFSRPTEVLAAEESRP